MANRELAFLRLFGEEPAGVRAADAGQQGDVGLENRAQDQQDAAASEAAAPRRMTWEEIKADPEYNREIQAIVAKRLAREKRPGAPVPEPDFSGHFQSLERQGEAMKAVFPGFDLRRELLDPAFARMTAPDVGISVEDAFYALHRQEIQGAAMEVAARMASRRLSDTIRSGAARPAEQGGEGQGAILSDWDYRSASPGQREALKKRIRQARARGEKIFPFGR